MDYVISTIVEDTIIAITASHGVSVCAAVEAINTTAASPCVIADAAMDFVIGVLAEDCMVAIIRMIETERMANFVQEDAEPGRAGVQREMRLVQHHMADGALGRRCQRHTRKAHDVAISGDTGGINELQHAAII